MLQDKKGLIVALDQGTTSSRSILYDLSGAELKVAQRPIEISYPKNGWVEQDPEALYNAQLETLLEVLESPEAKNSEILSLGVTNQRETVLAFDATTGKALSPAIVWQCRRTAERCKKLKESGKSKVIKEKTGLEIDAYFSASKIAWMIKNIPEVSKLLKEEKVVFGTIDTWVIYKLSGELSKSAAVTEPSNASRTMLFNIEKGDWDEELLDIFSIPKHSLANIVSSTGPFPAAKIKDREIPINAAIGDQQSSLFGLGCEKLGTSKCTFGTGAFMLINAGQNFSPVADGLLDTVAWKFSSDEEIVYSREGSVFVAGALISWLKDIGIIDSPKEAEALAKEAGELDDLFLVPSFTGLGAPEWDPTSRGLLIGLTRATSKAQIVKAAVEGVAHQVADLVDLFRQTEEVNSITIDGGMSQNSVLAQSLADFANIEVIVSSVTEATAFGAARLAAKALNLGDDFLIEQGSEVKKIFKPKLDKDVLSKKRAKWQEAVQRSKDWAQ